MNKQKALEVQLTEAVAHHQKGDREKAQNMYEEILKEDPHSFDANNLLGALLLQKEVFEDALKYIDCALKINNTQPNAWSNRALALKGLDRLEEALVSVNKAIELDLNFSDSFYNKANILAKMGKLSDAVTALDRFTLLQPSHHLGYFVMGNLLRQLDRKTDAISAYERAIALQPKFPEALSNLGLCLAELEDFERALSCFDKALKIAPQFLDCLLNKGVTLEKLGRYDEAITSYDLALQINPGYLEALQNKGVALEKLGKLEEAVVCYNTALSIDKNYAAAYFNRGYAHERLQKIDESIADYERAITLSPERDDIHWNRALMLLCNGDFKRGWEAYESRLKLKHAINFYETEKLKSFEWRGPVDSLQGKSILVRSEQGLGDTIQFCRYIKVLHAMGAKVIFEVQPPLVYLLKDLEGLDKILAKGSPIPLFDYYCNLMSLPLLLGTTIESIPNEMPYIKADVEKVAAWRQRLGPTTSKRVGLVWSGGFRPDQPELWPLNKRRNIELVKLKDFKTEGIEFHSLQKGELPEAELVVLFLQDWVGPKIINHADALNDFSDTAALIENLDLVITVDTSTAHLAGALGKPVWLMNRFDTCWRWFLGREDTPWYPTFRIFRQPKPDDWESVVRDIGGELKSYTRI
jgi:hypothetical protein